MHNSYYEALMEGRYPIHIETLESDAGWTARFADAKGHHFEVTDTSQAEAHRQCTAQVIDAIRLGHVVPEL